MEETWRDYVDPVAVLMCIKSTDDEDIIREARGARQKAEDLVEVFAKFIKSDMESKIAQEELRVDKEKKRKLETRIV